DKPDGRLVTHYDLPPSPEEYYQEAGRAGRDGLPSFAVLLASKSDPGVMRRRITEAFPERQTIKKTYERVCNFLHVSIGEGYDSVREFDINKFCRIFKIQERTCRASLRLLSQAGYLHFIEEPDSRSRLKIIVDREELYDMHDLSEKAEEVLSAALRTYTGLFADYVFISESEIMAKLNLDSQTVYEALLELSRSQIVSYIPHSGVPLIYFPTAREETASLLIGKDIYEKRIEIMSHRTEAILDYAFKSNSCRVERMLRYFGEGDSGECGSCDVCREKKKSHKKIYGATEELKLQLIIDFLKKSPGGATLQAIEINCGNNPASTSRVLSFLCNEGFAEYSEGIYRLRIEE
ncbi:MAG: RecQ family zinc-binding domain-containing protein, partial [Muribaculaceae bacterium]|nr:RecQ family zinc-binding domain-containing protein [Muribaculaceae bacterium]